MSWMTDADRDGCIYIKPGSRASSIDESAQVRSLETTYGASPSKRSRSVVNNALAICSERPNDNVPPLPNVSLRTNSPDAGSNAESHQPTAVLKAALERRTLSHWASA